MSRPYGHDYFRWAEEIAQLSVREPNLVAWGMDDFSHNGEVFDRGYTLRVLETARQINPELAFVPTVYYKHAVRPGFAQTMEQLTGMAWITGHVDDPLSLLLEVR